MIIPINSAIVSGIYGVVEFLLVLLLIFLTSRIIRYHNLFILYHRRRPLHLRPTRLSICSPTPLTTLFISRVCTFVVFLCVILLTATSNSFTGQSQTVLRTEKVTLLTSDDADDILDYRLHISPDGSLFSAVALFLIHPLCSVFLGADVMEFRSFINLPGDVNQVKWSARSTSLRNSTCLTPGSEFQQQALKAKISHDTTAATLTNQCEFIINFNKIQSNYTGAVQIPSRRLILHPRCRAKGYSVHCSTHNEKSCVVSLNMSSYFTLSAVVSTSLFGLAGSFPSEKPHPEVLLSSIAYLMDVGLARGVDPAYMLSRKGVIREGEVQRKIQVEVTRVNVGLLIGTLIPVSIICAGMVAVATLGWWTVGKGRKTYNAFSGVDEAKVCLRSELKRGEGWDGNGRICRRDGQVMFCRGKDKNKSTT